MSVPVEAIFQQGGNLIAGTVGNVLSFFGIAGIPDGKIGPIPVDVTLSETLEDTLDITEHPVESGASITDHAYRRPSRVTMHCGWSNANYKNLVGAANSLINQVAGAIGVTPPVSVPQQAIGNGQLSLGDYVSAVYGQLLNLQQSIQPIQVQTTIRLYDNMLIKSLSLTRDKDTSQALMITAMLQEVIIVNAQTIAPGVSLANQLIPANTASVATLGPVGPVGPVGVGPGGALPSSQWELLVNPTANPFQ